MKIRWLKSDQHYPPRMMLFKVGDIIDTDDLGVSDDAVRAWIAQGFAERSQGPHVDPEPEEIERVKVTVKARRKKKVTETEEA